MLFRSDVAGKVFGIDDWVTEIRVPGMLHARVIRPTKAGTTIVKVDESSIKAIPKAKVVRQGDFLAVVAPKEWDAVRASRALKVEWTAPRDVYPDMAKLHDHIRNAKVIKSEDETKVATELLERLRMLGLESEARAERTNGAKSADNSAESARQASAGGFMLTHSGALE